MTRTLLTAWVAVCIAVLQVGPAAAGEGLITKVRGRTLTIDKGADDGLEEGLEVTIVRPPEEPIIHPLTGENLGAPEIEIGTGTLHKVSARAASIHLDGRPIIPVRPGDVARFLTLEERMVADQEVATESMEKAGQERSELRSEAARLARNISSIQGSIRGLERAIRELRRFDDNVVKPQFNAINRQIHDMRTELEQLKSTVVALNAVPVKEIGEAEGEISPEEAQALRQMVQEEIDRLQAQLAVAPPSDTLPPPELPVEEDLAGLEGEKPVYAQLWFWGLIAAAGLAGVGVWFFLTQMGEGGDEDDEDDEFVDEEGDEDDDELDVDVEEEDDIVVEETS